MEKRCWIVGAGDFCARGWSPESGDLVIAADGGQGALSRLHARADIVVGDFDSLREAPNGGEVVRLPAEKDDTDMVAALRLALARGCRDIRIYGAAGGASTTPSPICNRSTSSPDRGRAACWWKSITA